MYTCPVCGYDRLSEPPSNFAICPSCGTEFEYDDAFATHAQLRAAWLRDGARWWSPVDARPDNWDPWFQVGAVTSSLWMKLRHSEQSRQGSAGLGDLGRSQGQQTRIPVPDLLRTAPKQPRTAELVTAAVAKVDVIAKLAAA